MASVQCSHINKDFGQHHILKDISLDIKSGEFLVLVGPSGCGKSTLLRTIAGLESPTQGDVLIDGKSVVHLQPRQRGLSMVFQNYALYPHLSVHQNLGFGLNLQGLPQVEINSRVKEVAELLQIQHLLDRRPKDLSGGQRQRVAVGRALVRKTDLILFDEPLSNLDAALRSQMRFEIKKLHQITGSTIIYVTHDQVEATTLGDRIAVLNQGVLEQIATPCQIYSYPNNRFVASFIGTPEINFLPGKFFGRPEAEVGIRPEAICAKEDGQLEAVVEMQEYLGSHYLIHARINGFALRFISEHCIPEGNNRQIKLKVDMAKLHFFDKATGARIS